MLCIWYIYIYIYIIFIYSSSNKNSESNSKSKSNEIPKVCSGIRCNIVSTSYDKKMSKVSI